MVSTGEKTTHSDIARTAPPTTIRSMEKAVDILELLGRESRGLAISDLSARLGMNVSTTHHLLSTLRARGLVAQDDRSKSYRVGSRLVAIVQDFLASSDLYPAAEAAVEDLRNRSGETSYLTVLQGAETDTIMSLPGLRPLQARRTHRPGQPNLHSTASGKLLLAYRPWEQAVDLMGAERARFTPSTLTALADLHDELATIRQQGYALDREEDYVGVQCVAAPVFDSAGECVACVSVSYPTATDERTAELIDMVAVAARRISAKLGASTERSRG